MEKIMAFKSKLPPQDQMPTETSAQTIAADAVKEPTEATPTPKVQEPYNDLVQTEAEEPPKEDAFVQFEVPEYPKSVYDSAHIENEMRDFNTQLGNANRPVIKEYTPPPVPPAIAEATRREMEAGRQRVAEFAAVEATRRVIMAQRPKEPWEGNTTQVFRPAAYVPDPKTPDRTGTLKTLQG